MHRVHYLGSRRATTLQRFGKKLKTNLEKKTLTCCKWCGLYGAKELPKSFCGIDFILWIMNISTLRIYSYQKGSFEPTYIQRMMKYLPAFLISQANRNPFSLSVESTAIPKMLNFVFIQHKHCGDISLKDWSLSLIDVTLKHLYFVVNVFLNHRLTEVFLVTTVFRLIPKRITDTNPNDRSNERFTIKTIYNH